MAGTLISHGVGGTLRVGDVPQDNVVGPVARLDELSAVLVVDPDAGIIEPSGEPGKGLPTHDILNLKYESAERTGWMCEVYLKQPHGFRTTGVVRNDTISSFAIPRSTGDSEGGPAT